MLLIPALGARGRRTPELRLIYKANSRTLRATQRNSALRERTEGGKGSGEKGRGSKATSGYADERTGLDTDRPSEKVYRSLGL